MSVAALKKLLFVNKLLTLNENKIAWTPTGRKTHGNRIATNSVQETAEKTFSQMYN